MTDLDRLDVLAAAAAALSVDEENAIRDFYARRTTRLSMGPSQSIPRLLATLDASRNAANNIAALGAAAVRERDELREALAEVLDNIDYINGPDARRIHDRARAALLIETGT